jgi:hypothetical protein
MPRKPRTYEQCREMAIGYFDEVDKASIEETGKPLERYKPMEPDCLDAAFRRALRRKSEGTAFIARLWSDNVFHQCMPNANHRSNMAMVRDFASKNGVAIPADGDKDRFKRDGSSMYSSSKATIGKHGMFGYGEKRLRRNHYKLAKRFFDDETDQSSIPTTMRADSLARFCASGVRTKDRGGRGS